MMSEARRCPSCRTTIPKAEPGGSELEFCANCGTSLVGMGTMHQAEKSEEAPDPLIGKMLLGCRIDALIGRGAMSTVYRARKVNLDKDVAVKVFKPELYDNPQALKRFQQEARIVAKFDTRHVVRIYDVAHDPLQRVHYLEMEYVEGGNLREYAKSQQGGVLSALEAAQFLEQASKGLLEAQSLGVVHRDIKPDNLLLDRNQTVKIADFGISKIKGASIGITHYGQALGTPLYASPEQCMGTEPTFQSDMYSLGASFFYLLTGQPPASGSSHYELIHEKAKIRQLSPRTERADLDVPRGISHIVERMTALQASDRYASFEEVISDCQQTKQGDKLQPKAPLAATSSPGTTRYLRPILLILVLALAAWAAVILFPMMGIGGGGDSGPPIEVVTGELLSLEQEVSSLLVATDKLTELKKTAEALQIPSGNTNLEKRKDDLLKSIDLKLRGRKIEERKQELKEELRILQQDYNEDPDWKKRCSLYGKALALLKKVEQESNGNQRFLGVLGETKDFSTKIEEGIRTNADYWNKDIKRSSGTFRDRGPSSELLKLVREDQKRLPDHSLYSVPRQRSQALLDQLEVAVGDLDTVKNIEKRFSAKEDPQALRSDIESYVSKLDASTWDLSEDRKHVEDLKRRAKDCTGDSRDALGELAALEAEYNEAKNPEALLTKLAGFKTKYKSWLSDTARSDTERSDYTQRTGKLEGRLGEWKQLLEEMARLEDMLEEERTTLPSQILDGENGENGLAGLLGQLEAGSWDETANNKHRDEIRERANRLKSVLDSWQGMLGKVGDLEEDWEKTNIEAGGSKKEQERVAVHARAERVLTQLEGNQDWDLTQERSRVEGLRKRVRLVLNESRPKTVEPTKPPDRKPLPEPDEPNKKKWPRTIRGKSWYLPKGLRNNNLQSEWVPSADPKFEQFFFEKGPDSGVRMVLVPGGKLTVGDEALDAGAPYLIDVYEVTVERLDKFLVFAEEKGTRFESDTDFGAFWKQMGRGDWQMRRGVLKEVKRPVCDVTLSMAEKFAKWAGKEIPTRQQWMCAAGWDYDEKRMRKYPWGDSFDEKWRKDFRSLVTEVKKEKNKNLISVEYKIAALTGDISYCGVHGMATLVRELCRERDAKGNLTVYHCGAESITFRREADMQPIKPIAESYWVRSEEETLPIVGFRCVIRLVDTP